MTSTALERSANLFFRYIDLVLIALFSAFVLSRRNYGIRFWTGMAIAAIGFSLWGVARIQLGSSFSVTAQAKKLVTTGLYSKFRHPVYMFGGIGYLGLLIALGNWIALAVFLAFYSYQIPRTRREDRVLAEAFGEEYRRYKARTWL
ncbi:MAG TPA: isoprenylcysteine carboxylmethyltransferase family protein [Candidatus Cybelea sp.]|nr:isoprenylcysteine carboxylmethyltransferase family protein [Candidatus Cybelea sp.]